MSETVGYIVLDEDQPRWAMKLDQQGVLWRGSTASVFPTRRHAYAAVDSTNRYATERGYKWSQKYHVIRVVREAHP